MILAVCGGKGGVGKSTVAFNVAAAADATLVDADLAMADLPTARGPDLHDVLAGRATAVEAVREGGVVDILPCGRTLAGARETDPAGLPDALRAVECAYGTVVVDCPAGMEADAGLPVYAADACLLVTEPERAAYAAALRTRELVRALDAGVLRVVLNRSRTVPPGVESAFGAQAVAVPEEDVVGASRDRGLPVAHLAPGGDAAAAFDALAAAVGRCQERT